jgi:hypothetical protein
MLNLPNERHSILLRDMCERLGMADPFRYLHPNKKEYTYIPRVAEHKNRSRIDFFLVSESLLSTRFDCMIHSALQGKMFDHRACTLTFATKKRARGGAVQIDNNILRDDIIDHVCFAAVAEAYLIHANDNRLDRRTRNEMLNKIGTIKVLIRQAGPPHVPLEKLLADNGVEWNANRDRF